MKDLQSERDGRRMPIDQVGVRDLRYPIVVLDRENKAQNTVARLTLAVNLPHQFKGTHMSRFIEVLNRHHGELTMHTLPAILADLKKKLHAKSARVEARFPYFLEKSAPVSGERGLMDYDCTFIGLSSAERGDEFLMGVRVPVMSLCPCSKAISDYGAHNQRGHVDVLIRPRPDRHGKPAFVWIEDLVALAESSGSSPVYPLLKREDERAVTMNAFDHPVFVEDMVRHVAVRLRRDRRVAWFRVEAANQESIHNHNAFALIEWPKPVVS